MHARTIATMLIGMGVLGACNASEGPADKASEEVQENLTVPSTDDLVEDFGDELEDIGEATAAAADDVGKRMEESVDPPSKPQTGENE